MTGLSITFSPLITMPFLTAFGIAALILFAYSLMRSTRGSWYRAVAALLLITAMLNPSFRTDDRTPIRDTALIFVDESGSMKATNRADVTKRIAENLNQKLAALSDLDIKTIPFSGFSETHLASALTSALNETPSRNIAASFIVTDGQIHDADTLLPLLKDAGPLHALLAGKQNESDRRLVIKAKPSYALIGANAGFVIRIEDNPAALGDSAAVTFTVNGGEPAVLDVPVNKDFPLDLPVERPGANIYHFEAEPAPSELTQRNNKNAAIVNGIRDRLHVLLVSGEPGPGERTWRNFLKSDPAVDLVHFTILRPPEKQDATPIDEMSLIAFPVQELFEKKLKDFDLIIFDRFRRMPIMPDEYLDNLADYVANGGALLDASGMNYALPDSIANSGLSAALPGKPTGKLLTGPFRAKLTSQGEKHPVTATMAAQQRTDKKEWGRWYQMADATVENGATLMTGLNNAPLFTLAHVGKGRVAQLFSDHIWLWSRGHDGGGPQAELLRRAAHWLMAEPELEEENLRARVTANEDGFRILIERQSLGDDAPAVTITLPSGEETKLDLKIDEARPGIKTAMLKADDSGIYTITDGTTKTTAIVGASDNPEYGDMRAADEKLKSIVEATGGRIGWHGDDADVSVRRASGRDYAGFGSYGLRRNGNYIVTGARATPLLPAALVLALTIAAIFFTWRREGKG